MMYFNQPTCPTCGQEPVGTTEWIPGTARLKRFPDGSYEHDGGTDEHFDGMLNQAELLPQPGQPRDAISLTCPDGHEWLTQCITYSDYVNTCRFCARRFRVSDRSLDEAKKDNPLLPEAEAAALLDSCVECIQGEALPGEFKVPVSEQVGP